MLYLHTNDNRIIDMNQIMFHTQEDRGNVLTKPIMCRRKNAWLGSAFYFWAEEEDAIRWGYDSKNGRFQVYSARIVSERVLDTVFNKEHYDFFRNALERLASKIVKKTGKKLSLNLLCQYLNERAEWKKEIDVLIINDNPQGEREIFPIPIRKRIQAAVYNEGCIREFKLINCYAGS